MDLLNSLHQKARVVKITLFVSQQTLDSVTYSKARSREKKNHTVIACIFGTELEVSPGTRPHVVSFYLIY